MKKYIRFLIMVLVSTLAMFILMYFNVFQLDQVYISQTMLYMTIMMGAVMAIIMLLFMWHMYDNKKVNFSIIAVSLVIFAGSLYLVRSQATVHDVSYMKEMISHHSMAILTSSRADLEDSRVQELAEKIIKAQEEEIVEMKELIQELENK